MVTETTTELTVRPSSEVFSLPDEPTFRSQMQAINRFQQTAQTLMIRGHDYGIIPGTDKPTLLKPGAEKIVKLLGLSDEYELVDRQEDWKGGFFRYLVRCKLVAMQSGVLVSTGLGECNSFESKYRYRWVYESKLPPGIDKKNLAKQEKRSKSGGKFTLYRLDNEDIYSQVNTILKMAKKRALVDAALSAGRLSDVFTQDVEDMVHDAGINEVTEPVSKPEPIVSRPDSITPEQIKTLNDLRNSGTDLKSKIDEFGWKAEKMADLTRDQAARLIEEIS